MGAPLPDAGSSTTVPSSTNPARSATFSDAMLHPSICASMCLAPVAGTAAQAHVEVRAEPVASFSAQLVNVH
jgi:hypothetical protein